jgi:hypothetical protein
MMNIKRPTWQQATLWDMVQAAQFGWPAPLPRDPHTEHGGVPTSLEGITRPVAARQIACASGQGPGKTFGSIVIMFWRQFRAPSPENPDGGKAVVTAPGMRQCQEVWLSEARKLTSRAHPIMQGLVDITATKVIFGGNKNWVIHCVTSTDEKKLQGFHDDGMTIMVEEMSGVARPVIEQFQGTLSNNDCMLIGIGNPNLRECAFYDCFSKNRDEWQTYQMDAEETAIYRPDVVSPRRNEQLAREYGKDSDVYRVRVRGLFPKSDPDAVFSHEELEPLTKEDKLECARSGNQKVISIDFARFGTNETVIYQRMGNAIIDYKVLNRVEPAFAVSTAFEMQRKAGWSDDECLFVPDATGMGQGVLFMFYGENKRIYEFHNGGKATQSRAYKNRITEAWFSFRKKLLSERICLPPDDRLIKQLVARKYKPTMTGQFALESKEEYSKRIEEDSPDRADALMMAFYDEAMGTSRSTGARSSFSGGFSDDMFEMRNSVTGN